MQPVLEHREGDLVFAPVMDDLPVNCQFGCEMSSRDDRSIHSLVPENYIENESQLSNIIK